jgi:ATP-binding protein involved in chromosome partitioning
MVCTPQSVALADCVKGIALFKETSVPVLGIIENMSSFICENCNHEHFIFGKDGAKNLAQNMDIPFLGQIPIESSLMQGGESGMPAVLANPNCASARAFGEMVLKILGESE